MYIKEKYIYSLRWGGGEKANSVTQSPPSGSSVFWTPWENAMDQDWGLVCVGRASFFFLASDAFFLIKRYLEISSVVIWFR